MGLPVSGYLGVSAPWALRHLGPGGIFLFKHVDGDVTSWGTSSTAACGVSDTDTHIWR